MESVSVGRLCVSPIDDGVSFFLYVEHDGATYFPGTSFGSVEICMFAGGFVRSLDPWCDEEARYLVERVLGRPAASEDELLRTAQKYQSPPCLPEKSEHWLWKRIYFVPVDGDPCADQVKGPDFLPDALRPSDAEITAVCKRFVAMDPEMSLQCGIVPESQSGSLQEELA